MGQADRSLCAIANRTARRAGARSDLWNHPAGDRMRHHPGRAMYDELLAALTSHEAAALGHPGGHPET